MVIILLISGYLLLLCLANMTLAAGFKQYQAWKLQDSPQHLPLCRSFVQATKK